MQGVQVYFEGQYACFTRPELKTERVSYDVPTPGAVRNMLQAIYWKPAIEWHIRSITVLKPIQFMTVKRNEVYGQQSESGGNKGGIIIENNRVQRNGLLLKDVAYIVDAYFTLTAKAGTEDTEEKHFAIIKRRLQNGQCFAQPFLGCREFSAFFREAQDVHTELEFIKAKGEQVAEIDYKDLGYMLYDVDYSNPQAKVLQPRYFEAKLINNVLTIEGVEVKQ
ncbi:MAG: type I-C CRISPR-associated protein Cas5c [Spirochaetaceae bacterium]|nr:type I-C CRISPR-associated protein Cas5c [Spirochaetaceae bacterium]